MLAPFLGAVHWTNAEVVVRVSLLQFVAAHVADKPLATCALQFVAVGDFFQACSTLAITNVESPEQLHVRGVVFIRFFHLLLRLYAGISFVDFKAALATGQHVALDAFHHAGCVIRGLQIATVETGYQVSVLGQLEDPEAPGPLRVKFTENR
jgi:hypothetical protein